MSSITAYPYNQSTFSLNMLYLTIFSVCLLAATCQAKSTQKPWYHPEDAEQHFEEFIVTHNKQYKDESEKNMRFLIFKEKLLSLNEKNSQGHSAIYGITKFSDLTKEEIKHFFHGLLPLVNATSSCETVTGYSKGGSAPESLDWRDKGKVTRVKYQAHCGSCWAFSVTGNVEGQYAMKHNELVELSEQQLLDCDKNDLGCKGGLMGRAINWLSENGGSISEKDYPYKAKVETCKADKSKAVVKVTGCTNYKVENEDELKQILTDVGPLSIGMDASPIMDYHGGVFTCPKNDEDLNHGVLLVGYGKDGDKPYWLFKNSWAASYGEEGYFRLEMYKNSCNMLSYINSAVVE